jgi:hypothetical protein
VTHLAKLENGQSAHVVRQHHPGIDVERMPRPRGPNGAAKRVDLRDEQIGASITAD